VALGKAIYAISITTIALGASQASQESSARSLEMANSRYGFVRRLRGQMKTFSEELLQQARLADRRGLYQGKP
jgi:hypothetical protein